MTNEEKLENEIVKAIERILTGRRWMPDLDDKEAKTRFVSTKDILIRVTHSKLITRNFDKRTIRLKLNEMTEKGILICKTKKGTYNQYTISNYKYEVKGDYFLRYNPF